jgi:hypothetical protein
MIIIMVIIIIIITSQNFGKQVIIIIIITTIYLLNYFLTAIEFSHKTNNIQKETIQNTVKPYEAQ